MALLDVEKEILRDQLKALMEENEQLKEKNKELKREINELSFNSFQDLGR